MVVPAGLVNNWHRELNETFHLDFEVFGSEGDVTDRKSNAFAKHNRLIASVDTLKRATRVKKILEAPHWDLIVFDEAHHLTAYQTGAKVTKTQNFKLAEALRDHSRDLLLLSATPHQGDHFRFWMLIRLLNPSLFLNTADMLATGIVLVRLSSGGPRPMHAMHTVIRSLRGGRYTRRRLGCLSLKCDFTSCCSITCGTVTTSRRRPVKKGARLAL